MDKFNVYMFLHIASNKVTAGNKTRLFLSPFHISTGSPLTLADEFRNNHVTACSTALRSATDENEWGGYVTAPCPSKVAQHSSAADILNSSDVTRLLTTEHIRYKYSLLKSRSVIIASIVIANFLTLSILI